MQPHVQYGLLTLHDFIQVLAGIYGNESCAYKSRGDPGRATTQNTSVKALSRRLFTARQPFHGRREGKPAWVCTRPEDGSVHNAGWITSLTKCYIYLLGPAMQDASCVQCGQEAACYRCVQCRRPLYVGIDMCCTSADIQLLRPVRQGAPRPVHLRTVAGRKARRGGAPHYGGDRLHGIPERYGPD